MKLLNILNKIIEYSFYGLFLLVPLAFASNTSELFEFNKMWLVFVLTIIIGASWFTKMILQRRILIQRTPLDIPIGLFLLSQIISTVFSLDTHISMWGYYSRWNGGLLSILSYIFLYYAFLGNFKIGALGGDPLASELNATVHEARRGSERHLATRIADLSVIVMVKRLLFLSLLSGFIVALWGLPSHFGYDPTCLLFRGTFDVSCWTADFQPKIRIFSTLGQPDWLAAYLAILIPIAAAFGFQKNQTTRKSDNQNIRRSDLLKIRNYDALILRVFRNKQIFYLLLSVLFYLALLYTRSRSGVLAVWISLVLLAASYVLISKKVKNVLTIGVLLLAITFFAGQPFTQLNKFTFEGIKESLVKKETTTTKPAKEAGLPAEALAQAGEMGGTDSGKIRSIVWKGAISVWLHNPIFGSGVETFAFAYYKYRPAAHNLTSEWNFLYNKAHNEFLNYLATTGIFGLGTYLLMIGSFFFLAVKQFKIQNAKLEKEKFLTSDSNFSLLILNFALLSSYISILITNFFGFSVVITNLYLFMIPAFVFVSQGLINPSSSFIFPVLPKNESRIRNYELSDTRQISGAQWTAILFIILTSLFIILTLVRFWNADKDYAYGYNLDRSGDYQQAYPYLRKAVGERGDEPVFKDELSVNNATLATALLLKKDTTDQKEQIATIAGNLIGEAIATSSEITKNHPNNLVFWKTRTRLFYTLSQINPQYLSEALSAIRKAKELAPTDANISYNLGVLEGQSGNTQKAIEALEATVKLKQDYKDARYGLGLFYHQAALDKQGKLINEELFQKGIAQMEYILERISSSDTGAKKALETWGR